MAVAAETIQTRESHRSFDPLASVNMMRHDLSAFSYVLPETLERIYDEELSYLAEGADRASRTTFALQRDKAGSLLYFDRGAWRPYVGMVTYGLKTAAEEAEADPRRQFLAEMAASDVLRARQMQNLRPGERMKWHSAYRKHEQQLYGKAFMRQCGLNPEREMGFIYWAECQADGAVILQSQTVDLSDDDAFSAAMRQDSLDSSLDAYDEVLESKHPGQGFYAGRSSHELERNAWETVRAQRDLVEYFLNQLENIARSDLEGLKLEEEVKRHVYGVWALFKQRLDGYAPTFEQKSVYGFSVSTPMSVAMEVQNAFRQFVEEGRVLVGCGGMISILQGEENILKAGSQDVFDAIFGRMSEESGGARDKFGPLNFKCPKGHWNKRRVARSPKDFLPNCKHCGTSLKC